MLELTLLGLHAIHRPDGQELPSLPAQPKRFALLAYLALGRRGGYHRRDTLAAIFWPEMDQHSARRALRSTLYHLRESLGDGVIISRGDDAVSINPEQLTSDVSRLEEAMAAGRFEEAVDRYRGEVLAGIHFAHAGEAFEEWLTQERSRVLELVMGAVRSLVDREDRDGNVARAAYWAQRGCALAPSDERSLRRAMTLLDRASDTGSALALYDSFERRLAAEFRAKPGGETQALAARIRTGSVTAPVVGVSATSEPVTGGEARSREAATALAPIALAPVPEEAVAIDAVVRPARAPRWRRVIIPALLIGVAVVAGFVVRARDAGHRGVALRTRVLVTVFTNRTNDSTLQSLGRMTQDWLVQGILRTGVAEVVDPQAVYVQSRTTGGTVIDPLALAHRTGAALTVSGSYYRAGDTLFFQAAVTDVRTREIVRVVGPVMSRAATPVAALDELRSRVMTALTSVVDVRATQNLGAGIELPPFDVYQAYVEGWDAYWHGDARHAEALFLLAGRRDSAFANAGLAAAGAAANSNDCPTVDSLARSLAGSAALDRSGRLSLQIDDARCRGRNDEMLRLTLERADLEPGNSSSQMSAAAAALWANRPARALELFKRVEPAIDLAWSTDTTHFAYWGGLAEAYHMLGRYQDELNTGDRIPPGSPLGRLWVRASALAASSRPTAALALIDSALPLPVETTSDVGLAPYTNGRPEYTMTPGWVANWISRELAVHGDTVASRQAAARAIAWYRNRPAAEQATLEEQLVAASSLEMAGDYAGAEALVQPLIARDSDNVDLQGELAGLAAERGDTALADSLDRWLAAQPSSRVSWSAAIYRARVAALLRRNDDAMARLREAFDLGLWPRWLDQEPALAKLSNRSDFRALTAPRS